MQFETKIGKSYPDKILIHGYDLTEDLIGTATLADMAFIGAKRRMPTKEESLMLNAILVAICEHGFTPSSISTRLTYLGAPESVQSAIAAGLLGAGTVYLGAMEYVAEMVQNAFIKYPNEEISTIATKLLEQYEADKKQLPGFGHPMQKPVDPRTVKLFSIADELGIKGKHVQLIEEINRQLNERKGKPITLNAVGAIGAIFSDMDFDYRIVKSFGVAARAVGLVAHVVEEIEHGRKNSIGQRLYDYVEHNTNYLAGETVKE